LVERFYSSYLYQVIVRLIAIINKPFSLSVAEIGLLVLVAGVSLWLLWLLQKAWSGDLSAFNLFAFLLHRAIWAGGVLLLLFLILWGFNYHRQTLAANLNLAGRETRPGELEAICSTLINRLNASYDAARTNPNWTSVNQVPLSREQLYLALEQSFQSLKLLGRSSQGGFGPPKPLLLSPLLSRLGISGIYSPFTGEANYNEESPACDLPFVIAHEKAHQRGFAREDEANFIGFLACVNAPDPFVQYSGFLQAMPRVMSVLATTNEEEYQNLVARIGEGARSDLQGRAAFWRLRESRVLSAVARRTNNTYLRANRVRSGIANYDEVTALIINYFLTYPNGVREQQALPAAPVPTPAPQTVAAAPRPLSTATPAPALQTEMRGAPTEGSPAARSSFIP
jgi:hypothetical protein